MLESVRPIAVVGGGTIGVGWAIVFARAGRSVHLAEPDAERRATVEADLAARLGRLASHGLLSQAPGEIAARVAITGDLASAVEGAVHVQECAPESLELKRTLFGELEALVPADAALATSSSALTISEIAGGLTTRARCFVAHPGNPPYLLPVVELVPAPFTDPHVVARASELFASVGMTPIHVRHEIEGFVFNRLQGAVLREAYCLVRDGIVSPEDVDRVMRDGLGRRWGVLGPFETAELNTRGGIVAHAAKMGPAYARMGAERGQHDPWTPELVEQVAADVQRRLPPELWDANVARRDEALSELERVRREGGAFAPPSPG